LFVWLGPPFFSCLMFKPRFCCFPVGFSLIFDGPPRISPFRQLEHLCFHCFFSRPAVTHLGPPCSSMSPARHDPPPSRFLSPPLFLSWCGPSLFSFHFLVDLPHHFPCFSSKVPPRYPPLLYKFHLEHTFSTFMNDQFFGLPTIFLESSTLQTTPAHYGPLAPLRAGRIVHFWGDLIKSLRLPYDLGRFP